MCAKARPSAARSPCAATACGSFWIACWPTALPRVRDFRGISPTSFDGRGNYTLGITEQLIFPEIEYDKVDRTRGMDITFVTTAEDNESAFALLSALGFPFKERVTLLLNREPGQAILRQFKAASPAGLETGKKELHG